ncbi:alpha/beta fold hydrolase [Bradyrhizobium sp. 14AA]
MPTMEQHRFRDLDGRSLRAGSGEPLLFLHGSAGLPVWSPFFDTMASKFDVAVPEHPGFGASVAPPWIRNVADMAMHYLDILDALNLNRVHLVGHSLGGWIAAEIAVRNTSHIASLTLIAPAGVRLSGVPSGDNFIWGPEESVRNLFHDQSFADRMLADALSDEEADLALNSRFMAARLGWEPRWVDPALKRWLHRIDVRTLVLWGDDDKLFPSAYASAWTESIPDSRAEIIKACGHLPHVEKAAETASRIVAFLGRK